MTFSDGFAPSFSVDLGNCHNICLPSMQFRSYTVQWGPSIEPANKKAMLPSHVHIFKKTCDSQQGMSSSTV